MGKLEYLRGNYNEALAILKEIPSKDSYKYEVSVQKITS